MLRGLLVLLLMTALPGLSAAQRTANQALVFDRVAVVDVANGRIRSDMTVVIEGKLITAAGRSGNVRIPPGAMVVGASGKFLIPGLWDMHVHALFEGRTDNFFALFIANGITGVRDMGSPLPLETTLRLRREIDDGKIVGPRIGALTGKILDGPGTPLNLAVGVATADDGRALVRSYKQQGADFIKVYESLPRDVFLAIADESRKLKIPFLGHPPFAVSAAEVSDLGMRSIEHNVDVLISAASSEAELRREVREAPPALSNQTRSRAEIKSLDKYDERKAAALFARFVKNRTWLCPTLATRYASSLPDAATVLADERIRYVPVPIRQNWNRIFTERIVAGGSPEERRRRLAKTKEVTNAMRRAGVSILAGTDTGWSNPGTYAGFTLHDELRLMVESGFTPLEALRTATVNPAEFLGLGRSLGAVERGRLADLVLLDENPLADIANTRQIAAVVANGRYYSRDDLRKLTSDVAAQVASAGRSTLPRRLLVGPLIAEFGPEAPFARGPADETDETEER